MLSTALDTVLQLLEFESGAIYLRDARTAELEMACHHGLSEGFRHVAAKGIISLKAADSGGPLIIEDLPAEADAPRAVVEEGYRSVASIPLLSREEIQGVLTIASRDLHRFGPQDVDLLLSVGHQIGVAIENARLFETEQRRAEQFRLIGEVGRRITSILPVDELLVQIARMIQEAFDYHHVGIGLIEGDEVFYKVGAGPLWDDSDLEFQPTRLKVGQEGITGWVAATGEPLLSPDVSQEPRYLVMPGSRTRSEVAVPIKAKERIIGVLDVQSDRPNTFDESDLVVLQSLASQAAMAIENARLFEAELRTAEQFRVISEVGRHMTSILDVDELLEEIVRLLKETFGYYQITIGLIEGDDLVFKAGAKNHWDGYQFRPPPLKVGEGAGITAWVAATGEPLLAPDVNKEPRYLLFSDAAEIRSELAVPLKTKEEVIGVLNVESDQLNAFDASDLVLLQSLANQAAIAIENARLFDAEQWRAEQFRAISEMGRHMTSILDVDELLGEIVHLIKDALGYYLVSIALTEGDELVFKRGAGPRWDDPSFQPISVKVGKEGITGWVAGTGEPLVVQDVSQEPRYLSLSDPIETESELAVPLRTKSEVIGVLNVESDHLNAFDESDLVVLQSLAHQAAIAIENARLYEQAQQLAVLEERQRLGRELHDSVTQSLYSVTLFAEAARRLVGGDDPETVQGYVDQLAEAAQQALKEMRLLVYQLRPLVLERVGLVEALRQRLEAVERRAGVDAELQLVGQVDLPSAVEDALYRIAQEALNNALKHAAATVVTVRISGDGDRVELEVKDNGRGFDPDAARDSGGMGLVSMRERAEQLGGSLTLDSAPGEGASVKVEVEASQ